MPSLILASTVHTTKQKKSKICIRSANFPLSFFLSLPQFSPNCFPIHMLTIFFLLRKICVLLETYKAHFSLLLPSLQIMNVLFINNTKTYMLNKSDLFFIIFFLLWYLLCLILVFIRTANSQKSQHEKNLHCINFYPFLLSISLIFCLLSLAWRCHR